MGLIPSNATVTVETKFFPPLTVNVAGASGGPPNFLTQLVKPRVTVAVGGAQLASVTPAGSPDPNLWPTVRWVLAGVVALALYGGLRLGLKVGLPLAVGVAALGGAKVLGKTP